MLDFVAAGEAVDAAAGEAAGDGDAELDFFSAAEVEIGRQMRPARQAPTTRNILFFIRFNWC